MAEAILAFLANFKNAARVLCFVIAVNACLEFASCYNSPARLKYLLSRVKGFLPICLPIWLLLIILACLPSMDELWKVRIALIKYKLASTENLQKASDTIERIGHKLECRYLGCDEKKELK